MNNFKRRSYLLVISLCLLVPSGFADPISDKDPCLSASPDAPACRPKDANETHDQFCGRIAAAKKAGNPGYSKAYCAGENFDVRWLSPKERPKHIEARVHFPTGPNAIRPDRAIDPDAPGAAFAKLLGLVLGGVPVLTYEALGGKCESICHVPEGQNFKTLVLETARLIPSIPVRGIANPPPTLVPQTAAVPPMAGAGGRAGPPDVQAQTPVMSQQASQLHQQM